MNRGTEWKSSPYSTYTMLCEQICQPQNQKYVTHCTVVRGGPSQPQVTRSENFTKFGHVVFEIQQWTVIYNTHWSQYFIWHVSVNFGLSRSCYSWVEGRRDRQINRQAGLFLRPDCSPGPNAASSECPTNVLPNSEFRTCPDPEFPNALRSEFMNTPNIEFLNVPLCTAPMSYLGGSKWGRPLCYGHAAVRWCLQRARGACVGSIALDRGVASILALWR